MATHSLKFVTVPYHDNILEAIAATFRERGWAVVPDVFERDSVDEFEKEIRDAIIRPTDGGWPKMPNDSSITIWPTRAPRLRAIVDRCLSGDLMRPRSSMFENSWLCNPSQPEQVKPDQGWHKDRGHRGTAFPGYQYPKDVHVSAYYTDMTLEKGPTQLISRSHIDQSLSPFSGAPFDSCLIKKQEIVIWDQRCWHRGTNRTLPGERINSIFGFYSVPVYHDGQHRMSKAQRIAAREATTPDEKVLYGGPFYAEDDTTKDPYSL
jgi:ectoine hydroxylase-related dioxygenase (phytanoyl-CoA dioxygenase family)